MVSGRWLRSTRTLSLTMSAAIAPISSLDMRASSRCFANGVVSGEPEARWEAAFSTRRMSPTGAVLASGLQQSGYVGREQRLLVGGVLRRQ